MALLLALAANVGVGTMVESFRRTFLGYLDQRLASELYVTARDDAEAAAIADWLAARPEVAAVLPTATARTRVADWPVDVVGFRDHATYRDNWPLAAASPDAWDRVAGGEAALVSEQLARRLDLWPGATLTLPTPGGPWSLPVAAVYPDYGNAEGQVMVAKPALDARWPEADRRRLAVRVAPEATARLAADLRAAFALEGGQVADQRAVKAVSTRIFEQTFAVTVALNALTLAVAGVALLTSLLTLADARLVQLAPLWASGVPRRRLAALELARALGLAGAHRAPRAAARPRARLGADRGRQRPRLRLAAAGAAAARPVGDGPRPGARRRRPRRALAGAPPRPRPAAGAAAGVRQ